MGADKHGCTQAEFNATEKQTGLVRKVQTHLVRAYIKMLKNPRIIQYRKKQKAAAAEKENNGYGKLGRGTTIGGRTVTHHIVLGVADVQNPLGLQSTCFWLESSALL